MRFRVIATDQIMNISKQSCKVELTPEQIEMLTMSEEDIKAGRLIPEEELKALEPDWLKH
ncbi:hypothetical protein GCM10007424_17430 [Flavobacterium suaedae]|uniref:Uncharacterized protein n=1 Tax=Flavobacterium suaedae TaxID=1767027 RepID=A0ABQ1JYB1_9FLAO|nr:hypothetical protein GCM10007424_17430 [Flavobacterium suaedae]